MRIIDVLYPGHENWFRYHGIPALPICLGGSGLFTGNPRLRKFGPKVRLSAKVAAFGKPSKVSGFESAWTAPRVDRELQKLAMKEFSELTSSISIMRPTKDGKS
jgi:hypothetical protein